MAVIVNDVRVRVGKKTYAPGETIEGLDKAEEKRLVDAGYCQPADAKPAKSGKGKDKGSAADTEGTDTNNPGADA
jgi:hypothetical protein